MLEVEVVTHVLGSMEHCPHCQVFIDGAGVGGKVHQDDLDSYPPDWRAEWQRLSDWILRLAAQHAGQLRIKIIDAQSLGGMWRALRHGVRKYPTFIVGGEQYHGWDEQVLEDLINRKLAAAT
jgi:hypothetical protein